MPADRAIGRDSDPSRWETNTWLLAWTGVPFGYPSSGVDHECRIAGSFVTQIAPRSEVEITRRTPLFLLSFSVAVPGTVIG